MSRTRWIVLVVAIVILGSLAGYPQLSGLIALATFLVFVIAVATGKAGVRPRSGRSARRINYLARYTDLTRDERLGGALVAAFAAWSIMEVTMPDADAGALLVALLVPPLFHLLSPQLAGAALGIGGVVCTFVTLFRDDDCRPRASLGSMLMLTGVLGVFVLVNLATLAAGSLMSSVPRVLAGRIGLAERALLLFGLLDVALFVARPTGLDIWDDAPGWAVPAALALIGVIAVFGTYAIRLVLGLLGLAMALAHTVLVLVEHGLIAGSPTACGDPLVGLLWSAAAFVLIVFATALRSPLRGRGVLGAR